MFIVYYETINGEVKIKPILNVGVMKDQKLKLRNIRVFETLGCLGNCTVNSRHKRDRCRGVIIVVRSILSDLVSRLLFTVVENVARRKWNSPPVLL
jgi:hypothetical protein